MIRDFVAHGFSVQILLGEMAPGDNEACPVGAVCGDDVRCSSGSLYREYQNVVNIV